MSEPEQTQTQPLLDAIDGLENALDSAHNEQKSFVEKFAMTTIPALLKNLEELFEAKAAEVSTLEKRIEAKRRELGALTRVVDSQKELEKALELLDELWHLADDENGRLALAKLVETFDIWVGLAFEVYQPRKRKMLRLVRGLISFGGYKLPEGHYRYAGTGKHVVRTLVQPAFNPAANQQNVAESGEKTLSLARSRTRQLGRGVPDGNVGTSKDNLGNACDVADNAVAPQPQTPGGWDVGEAANSAS